MKHHDKILRLLQWGTAFAFFAAVGLAMALVTSKAPEKRQKVPRQASVLSADIDTEKTQKPGAKVKRVAPARNATYRELLDEGDRANFRGDLESAIASYIKASALEPKELTPYIKIGDASFSKKDYSSALKYFQLAENMQPLDAGLKIKIVRTFIGMRKILEAQTKLKSISPPTQTTLYYQGLFSALYNDQDAAKKNLAQSAAAGNDKNMQETAKKILDAYDQFSIARDSPPDFLQAMLAQIFDQAEEYGLAIELAFSALKSRYDYRDVWIVLGHSLLNERKFSDAEEAFGKAISLDAGHSAPFFFRGMGRKLEKNFRVAAEDFEEALKLGWKPRVVAVQQLADSYFELKNFDKAFPLYSEAAMTDPSDIRIFVRPMALAINHLQKPAEAVLLAKKAYETHPNAAMGHNLLGWAALANGELSSSQSHLEEALKLDAALASAHLNRAQLAELQNDWASARSGYEKAIELAKKSDDDSVGNTAILRYNALKQKIEQAAAQGNTGILQALPKPAPDPQIELKSQATVPFIPSLSLQ
ncbi:tetratricopeptide repeat protein [Candidatus Peregrinibacteria bacterium]|nr:tetratricopeptide repeat protein [Candidatus Peregrinibacteria bacterium]